METVREGLLRRHMNLELHRPVVCEQERTATFYLWNLSGQMVGYQLHRPDAPKTSACNNPRDGRYYTYRKQPTHGVWGVESLCLSDGPVFVTEGVFDAARMTAVGQSALAMCANNPQRDMRDWLYSLARPVVVVCDNDKNRAGNKLAKFGHYVEYCPKLGMDLGDAPQDFVNYLVNKYNPNNK
jgi:hypothetical protein